MKTSVMTSTRVMKMPPVVKTSVMTRTSVMKTRAVRTTPEVKTLDVKTLDVKTIEVKTPEVKTAEVKTIEVKTPVAKTKAAHQVSPATKIARRDTRIALHVDSPHMARLTAEADIAIGAAGSSTWERCTLGLPTLMLVLAGGSRLITWNLSTGLKRSRWQNLLEIVVTGMEKQIEDVGLSQPKKYIGFLGTLFLFVGAASLCTLIPGYEPPTANLKAQIIFGDTCKRRSDDLKIEVKLLCVD